MGRLKQGVERRRKADRRTVAAGFWREDLERRSGMQRRMGIPDRRHGKSERRSRDPLVSRKSEKNRQGGETWQSWVGTGVIPETASTFPPCEVNRLRLCSMIEVGRCGREDDLGIYVNNTLAGTIIHKDGWQVWRLIETGGVSCASELRMYRDRLCHMATFQTFREARAFVTGPFKRHFLAEMEMARNSGTVKCHKG